MAVDENPIEGPLAHATPIELLKFPDRVQMTRDEMCKIVDTARRLLSDGYVHLQLKQSIHAANPLDRLRALTSRLTGAAAEGIAEAEFHDEMVSIFTALRDLHTVYVLPREYSRYVAFLPFMIEECHDDGRSRFVVSKLNRDVDFEGFVRGAEVTGWNGMPIERAVQLNGQARPGSNPSARRARAIGNRKADLPLARHELAAG